jgi:hypothetical protein
LLIVDLFHDKSSIINQQSAIINSSVSSKGVVVQLARTPAPFHTFIFLQLAADEPAAARGPDSEQFIAHGRVRLNIGWQTIEVYPPLGDEYWKPQYAAGWAELDILAAVAQRT